MANKYVTVAGAGTKAGTSWGDAFGLAEFESDLEASASAGDQYFIKEGTYTLASAISTAIAGNTNLPIELIGVVSATSAEPPTSSDWATDTNRPLFSGDSSYYFKVGNVYIIRNIHVTGAHTSGSFSTGTRCKIFNGKFTTTGATLSYEALITGANSHVVDCEFMASSGGVGCLPGGYNIFFACYFHDCGVGIYAIAVDGSIVNHCIFDTCLVRGIYIRRYSTVINNTIYNCAVGINLYNSTWSHDILVLNNTIVNCTDGMTMDNSGTVRKSIIFDYNNWYNNTSDMSWDNGSSEDNSAKGLNALAVDPQFTDAPNGDFSLDSASGLIGTGFNIRLGV